MLDLGPPLNWMPISPQGTPPPARYGHTAVYDQHGDRLLIYGGTDGTSYFGDVWALTLGSSPTWSPLSSGGTAPAPRAFHSAIYDSVHDQMVIFGGTDGSSNLGDAAALALSPLPAWSAIAPLGPSPPARQLHSAIYDTRNRRMVVYGGKVKPDTVLDDVWSLDLNTPAWTQLLPTGTPPPGRSGHKAYYDALRSRMVVSLGTIVVYCPTPTCVPPFDSRDAGDTWALTLTGPPEWTPISTNGLAPQNNASRLGAYHPLRNRLHVLGAEAGSLDLEVSSAWNAEVPAGSAPSLVRSAGAWDASGGQFVAFADGVTSALPVLMSWAIWERTSTGTPPARSDHNLVLDTRRNQLILFGGISGENPNWTLYNDVWVLPLVSGGTWSPLATTGSPPAGRRTSTAVYDATRDRLVIFGGYTNENPLVPQNDAWQLSLGSTPTWSPISAIGGPPGARGGHSAIYDPGRDRMVIFGGSPDDNTLFAPPEFDDVWALTFSGPAPAWTLLPGAPSDPHPRQRTRQTAVFDTSRDRMIVLGGDAMAGSPPRFPGDLWEYDFGASAWNRLDPAGDPHPGSLAVADGANDRMIVFAGGVVWLVRWGGGIASVPPIRSPYTGALMLDLRSNPVLHRRAEVVFGLPADADARLELLDTAGRGLATLALGHRRAGPNEVEVDLRAAPGPGIYFLRLVADRRAVTRRIVMLE